MESKIVKHIEVESEMVVTRDLWEKEMGRCGQRVQSCSDTSRMHSVDLT